MVGLVSGKLYVLGPWELILGGFAAVLVALVVITRILNRGKRPE